MQRNSEKMNIAILAHDNKKELLVQLCTAYKSILEPHKLYAPTTTGSIIQKATGIPVTLLLPCANEGSQQIGTMIACREIDLVLFLCDPFEKRGTKDMDAISRLCDNNGIPYASNIATAEMLIQGLRNGSFFNENYRNRQ